MQPDRDDERETSPDQSAQAPVPDRDVDARRAEEDKRADRRDEVAALADTAADSRDSAAELRDLTAEATEKAQPAARGRTPDGLAAGARNAAAGDREASRDDRHRARQDRTTSRQARKDAAEDRVVAHSAVTRLIDRLLQAEANAGDMRSIGEAQDALMQTQSLNEDEAVAEVAARAAHDHTELGSAARSIIAES